MYFLVLGIVFALYNISLNNVVAASDAMQNVNNITPFVLKASSFYEGMSSAQSVHAQLRLSQSLQSTLDPKELLNTFFVDINATICIHGMTFLSSQYAKEHYSFGIRCLHHLSYRLVVNEMEIGEILFFRKKPFSDIEQKDIEFFLSMLVYPLRNAVCYRDALRASKTDPLTELGNRLALDETLKRELQLAQRYQDHLSIAVIDVDFFKRINDTYGHQVGDTVLKRIGETLHTVCRSTDMAFRFGGEEFVVVLSKTDALGAQVIAERLREAVATLV